MLLQGGGHGETWNARTVRWSAGGGSAENGDSVNRAFVAPSMKRRARVKCKLSTSSVPPHTAAVRDGAGQRSLASSVTLLFALFSDELLPSAHEGSRGVVGRHLCYGSRRRPRRDARSHHIVVTRRGPLS
jgi:hypothetical protein